MKKRHEQKLILLSILLVLVINIPIVMIFNQEGHILGFPTLYFYLFSVWLCSILISYFILKKHYE
ncbi:MAG: hypothetical protein ABF242_05350 [Flavobacteriales bacterium]